MSTDPFVHEVVVGTAPVTLPLGDSDGPELVVQLVSGPATRVPRPRPQRAAPDSSAGFDELRPVDQQVDLRVHDLSVTVSAVSPPGRRLRDRLTSTVEDLVGGTPARKRPPEKPRAAEKVLIEGVTFPIPPARLVAIIGPSGAGKSTLLKALVGLTRASGGVITYNGRSLIGDSVESEDDAHNMRKLIGYVPQDDILHPELVLEEALDLAARLRLPDENLSRRVQAIDATLAQLRLKGQSEQRIGELSGGQRKRASVAPELLSRPPLLFLDEPTTGLDPDAEKVLVGLFQRLAHEGGSTVVMVTHAAAVLDRCDLVLAMGRGSRDGSGREPHVGQLACLGSPAQVLEFFGAEDFAEVYERLQDLDSCPRYPGSDLHHEHVRVPMEALVGRVDAQNARASASPVRQMLVLMRRNLSVVLGNGRYSRMLLAQAPLMAALLYLVLGSGNLSGRPASEPRQLLAFLVVGALAMGLVNSSREVVKELPIYLRERTVGLSTGAYLMSKLLFLTGLALAQSLLLALVLVGQGAEGAGLLVSSRGLELTLVLFLATLAASAGGLWISALVSSEATALVMVPVLLVAQLLLTGAFLKVQDNPVLAPVAVATPAYWAFAAAASSSDMLALEGRCTRDGEPPPDPLPASITCSGRWQHTGGSLTLSILALTLQVGLFSAGALAALRRRDPLLA